MVNFWELKSWEVGHPGRKPCTDIEPQYLNEAGLGIPKAGVGGVGAEFQQLQCNIWELGCGGQGPTWGQGHTWGSLASFFICASRALG